MIKSQRLTHSSPRIITAAAPWLGVASMMVLGFARASVASDEAFDCTHWLQPVVNFNIQTLKGKPGKVPYKRDRINAEAESITPDVARSYHVLRAEMDELKKFLSSVLTAQQLLDCSALSINLSSQLESFFDRRLTYLLDQGDGLEFFKEYGFLFSPWELRSERLELGSHFQIQEKRSLQFVREWLFERLRGTQWESYEGLNPLFDRWGDEWVEVLGRDAPGAVLIEEGRVALQISGLNPIEIETFMFHELSHLANPRVRDGQTLSDKESEMYAWQETLSYLKYLRSQKVPVTTLLEQIEKAIEADGGLQLWVEDVLRARKLGHSRHSVPIE